MPLDHMTPVEMPHASYITCLPRPPRNNRFLIGLCYGSAATSTVSMYDQGVLSLILLIAGVLSLTLLAFAGMSK